jgi:hypothetical protein
MLEKIICIEGLTCERSVPSEGRRLVREDIEVTLGKRRASIPHMLELESVVRRGF